MALIENEVHHHSPSFSSEELRLDLGKFCDLDPGAVQEADVLGITSTLSTLFDQHNSRLEPGAQTELRRECIDKTVHTLSRGNDRLYLKRFGPYSLIPISYVSLPEPIVEDCSSGVVHTVGSSVTPIHDAGHLILGYSLEKDRLYEVDLRVEPATAQEQQAREEVIALVQEMVMAHVR
jgi:hypothetical protein